MQVTQAELSKTTLFGVGDDMIHQRRKSRFNLIRRSGRTAVIDHIRMKRNHHHGKPSLGITAAIKGELTPADMGQKIVLALG